MLKPAILGLIRQILIVACTALAAQRSVQTSDPEQAVGTLPGIRHKIWSVADKRRRPA